MKKTILSFIAAVIFCTTIFLSTAFAEKWVERIPLDDGSTMVIYYGEDGITIEDIDIEW